jgi:hypothetical protein
MTFADGAPIDAAQLTALETTLNDIKALIPKIGTGTGTVAPQIYGGTSAGVTLSPLVKTIFTIDYSAAALSAVPTSIILTPVFPGVAGTVHAHIVSGTATATTATCEAVFLPIGSAVLAATAVSFNYIVICH